MKPLLLHEAREVWRALFRAGMDIPAGQWQAWSDSRLLVEEAPPSWLLALSTAESSRAALAAVERDIGREPEHSPDPEALVIGLVVQRHVSGELSPEDMWAKLRDVADITEFVDSGKWKRYGASPAVQEAQGNPLFIRCLTPVASYASEMQYRLLSQAAGV